MQSVLDADSEGYNHQCPHHTTKAKMWLRWGLQRGCERSECSSNTYELEYSSYVMILAYELAYNFDVMSLAYRTLCLIIHITYMIRIRAKLRCWFVIPLGLPMSYACRSIGSESRGDIGSFFIHGHGPWVYENLGM
jgi:hypothetical protein